MNKNFKYSLIAVVAILASISMGKCQGMQTSAEGSDGVKSEATQATESSHVGAFGAVKPATKIRAEEPEPAFPPIVTGARAKTPPIAKLQELTPPILIPKQFDASIVSAPVQPLSPSIVQSGSRSDQPAPSNIESDSGSEASNPPIVRATPPSTQPSSSQQADLMNKPLPLVSQALPPISQALPPISQALPPISQALPPISQALPPISQALPPISQALPPISQALPPSSEVLPFINEALPPINQAMPSISQTPPAFSQQRPPINQPTDSSEQWNPPIRQSNQAKHESSSTIVQSNPPIIQSTRPVVQSTAPIVKTEYPSNSAEGQSTPSIVEMAPPIVPAIATNDAMGRHDGPSDRAPEKTAKTDHAYAKSAPDADGRGMKTFHPNFDQPFPASVQVIPGIDPVARMAIQEDSRGSKSVMLAPIQTSERTQSTASPNPVNQTSPRPMNQMAAKQVSQPPAQPMNQMATPPVQQMPVNAPLAAQAISPVAAPIIQATNAPTEFETNQDVRQAAQWGQPNHLARGVSAAGIPLYQGSRAATASPAMVDIEESPSMIESQTTLDRAVPPAPSISSSSQYVSPIESMSPPAPMPATARPAGMDSNKFMAAKTGAMPPNFGARQNYFEQQPMEAPVMMAPGCPICGTPMPINGASCPVCTNAPACDSCGGRGCPDCGIAGTPGNPTSGCATCGAGGCYNPNAIAEQFGDCGSVSQARGYFVAEALYLNRRDGIIANSNFGALSNFDWTAGLHLTVGRRRDSISGRELSYFGTDEITEDVRHFDAQGRIDARFNAGDGFLASEITAFKNAVEQVESKQTELHSLEFNKVEWGWDVVKTYVGLRYLYIEDSYQMASRNVFNEQGLFEVYVKNNLIGPNWGTEIYYDVGSRLSGTFIARGGLYGSISKVRTKLNNNGTQILNVEDDNSTIGGTLEFGVNGRFKITRRANLRFGYNLMLISRVAEASNNVPRTITPSIGAATSNTNDMQFHGANIGFEIYR